MATRANPMRTRGATAAGSRTVTSVKDENASAFGTVSSGATHGGLSAKDAALLAVGGGKAGGGSSSSSSQQQGGVKKTALGGKEALTRAAGAKRPALGNISNAGGRDPHVDTEIPSKATKLATGGHSRSRSTSVSTTGGGGADEVAQVKSRIAGGGAVRSSKAASASSMTASKSSSAVLEDVQQRQTTTTASRLTRGGAAAPTSRPVAKSGSFQDASAGGRLAEVHEEEDATMKSSEETTQRAARHRDSGLTPSLNGMNVVSGLQHFGGVATQREVIEILDDEDMAADGDVAGRLEDAEDLLDDQDVDVDDEEDEEEDEVEDDENNWMALTREQQIQVEQTLHRVRESFDDEVDMLDTTMVAEYSEDIFAYMEELEETALPSANYMDHQSEIEWSMRTTLIDWLLQVHLRYHMLPETLWIAVNIVDRFLSARVVSLVKLQLVGVTAMFVAAKYEEILAPSVEEFVYMTENGYTKEEILKGERIILQTLNFEISSYCSPYSWVRKISKADDYDIQTRTLSKFLMEVTLLDHQFLRAKPSYIAAVGMYVARRMLDGDWNDAFVFYSNFTETQLLPGAQLLVDNLNAEEFDKQYVYKKYANKKFLRASTFAKDWAKKNTVLAPISA